MIDAFETVLLKQVTKALNDVILFRRIKKAIAEEKTTHPDGIPELIYKHDYNTEWAAAEATLSAFEAMLDAYREFKKVNE